MSCVVSQSLFYSFTILTIFFCPRFCATRWVEDEVVADRAIKIWENVIKLVKHWLHLPKSKRPKDNKSYDTLVKYHLDETMLAKFHFFKHIASLLQEFLVSFQTDKPMVPFLATSLENVLRKLMKKFVSPHILEEENTPYKLVKLDLSKKDVCLPAQLVDVGTATKTKLKSLKLSSEQKLKFKNTCLSMLKAIVEKLQERCPLKYSVVRCASCLDPTSMVSVPEVSKLQFNALIDKLYSSNWLPEKRAEEAKVQFDEFLSLTLKENQEKFSKFDWKEQRVDGFLGSFLHRNEKYKALWDVCQIVFICSHGQSSIERGFSVNKELLVENLSQQTLIGQRIVYDYFTSLNVKIHEYKITGDLSKSCKLANSRYKSALAEKKKTKEGNENDRKRKLMMDELADVKRHRDSTVSCIEVLNKDIEKYSFEAEEKRDMDILSKANALRKAVTEKRELVKTLGNAVENLEKEIKEK